MTRRFFLPPEAIDGDDVIVPPKTAHHITRVLRLKSGERIAVFDGSGREYLVEMTVVEPDRVRGRVLETHQRGRAGPEITLVQGIPKAAKMDTIVRMGTEVGVARFAPVVTRRSIARPSRERVERWRRIAAEASRQSGRQRVPQVLEPCPLPDVWAALEAGLILMPWEGGGAGLGDVLAEHRDSTTVAIAIGPEGGFAEEEVADAQRHGAVPVSLGPLILRTETAGLVAASMVLYELTLRPSAG